MSSIPELPAPAHPSTDPSAPLEPIVTELVDEMIRMGQQIEQLEHQVRRLVELQTIAVNTAMTTAQRTESLGGLLTELLRMMNGPAPTATATAEPEERVRYVPFSLAGYPPYQSS